MLIVAAQLRGAPYEAVRIRDTIRTASFALVLCETIPF
jgi:hypothetical protein